MTPEPTKAASLPAHEPGQDVTRLRDLSGDQWRSGIAAWLGWLFDGLDMHLYTLVAVPFVAELLRTDQKDPNVGWYGSLIQAAFLLGWALGGGFFGRIGDRLGRSRALVLTILTYACFTGLSYFAEEWWHLFIFRFLAALGIGGEWAVGAALLSETWPSRWRPWIAGVLQCAVNIGVLMATAAVFVLTSIQSDFEERTVFLIGVLPAFLVVWIRRAVPEPEEWHAARAQAPAIEPGVRDLFRGSVRRITVLTVLVCSLAMTAHWAFMFWCFQHLRSLPEVTSLDSAGATQLITGALTTVMISSIFGNFLAAALARMIGYRRAIAALFFAYFFMVLGAYGVERDYAGIWPWLIPIGMCQGAFALFTMYLPPLFPTLLRTTGAGFCYNIGRIAAAFGTVYFALFKVGDFRFAILYASCLIVPAAAIALLMPEPPHERSSVGPVE